MKKAHVIHKGDGTIESVVVESGEVQGNLEISVDESDAEVTVVEDDSLPDDVQEITKGYRVDKQKKALLKRR